MELNTVNSFTVTPSASAPTPTSSTIPPESPAVMHPAMEDEEPPSSPNTTFAQQGVVVELNNTKFNHSNTLSTMIETIESAGVDENIEPACVLAAADIGPQAQQNRKLNELQQENEGKKQSAGSICNQKDHQQKRLRSDPRLQAIATQASLYVSAFFMTYFWSTLLVMLGLAGISFGFWLHCMLYFFLPLQGFWNCLIFLKPAIQRIVSKTRKNMNRRGKNSNSNSNARMPSYVQIVRQAIKEESTGYVIPKKRPLSRVLSQRSAGGSGGSSRWMVNPSLMMTGGNNTGGGSSRSNNILSRTLRVDN